MGASSSKKKKDKKDATGGLSSAFDQLKSGVEQTTQNLAESSQKAIDDATKLASDTSDSIKKQVQTAEGQVQKTASDVTTGLKDKADSVSKTTEETIKDTTAEVEKQIQGVASSIQKKSEEAKETVDSKIGQAKSQAEASKAQLKGQVDAAASKVSATTENVKNSLNDFSKQGAATVKNLESQANEARKTAENKASEFKGATEAKVSELKGAADSKTTELKDAAQKKAVELRGTVDDKASELKGKATELKSTVDSKVTELKSGAEAKATEFRGAVDSKATELKSGAEATAAGLKSSMDSKAAELKSGAEATAAGLKSTMDSKAAELKSGAESKAAELKGAASELKSNTEAKVSELRSNVDSKSSELKNSAQAKADDLKGSARAKANEAQIAANTAVSQLNSNMEQLKKEADNTKQGLQQSLSETQDKIDKGRSDLGSEAKGNAAGLAEGLKSSVTGAIEGAVHVATDAAHKTVEGVSHTLTKATSDVTNSLTGAVTQVSSSVSSTAGSVIPGLLSKVGNVGTGFAHGASNLNKMAEGALGKAADVIGLAPTVTVCKVEDLKDGEMRVFKVSDDGSILLVKENGKFSALGTKCSHYGAPLVKGVLCNGTVRCPWHGACFSTKTGDIEDSPGLDSIPSYKVTVEDGEVKVEVPPELLKHNLRTRALSKRDKEDKRNFVIIGGGGAAESCAETLRQNGYTGQLVVLTKEDDLPYDRPKLSKALSSTGKELALRSEDYFKNGDIEVLRNHEVASVDVAGKTVKCTNNASFSFDKLMIATGGKPSTLDVPGKDLNNIFYLRTPGDANNIAEAAKNKNAVIIGTSFIGMEVASYMNGKAKSVVVVGRSKTPFANVFGEQVGEQLKKLCSEKGIQFFTETGVSEFVGTDGKLSAIKLLNGEELPADLCVIGIGVKPSTEFLKGSGISLNQNGFIPVDQNMKTSIEGVYSAGDIVEFPLPLFNKSKVNIGHWQMAQSQGRQAAYSMLEIEKHVPTVPFFWCALFGKSVRYAGYGEDVDDYIIDGDLSDLKFVLYACSGNKVVAVATMGSDPVASNFASFMCSGKTLTKSEIQSDPQRWITSCGLK